MFILEIIGAATGVVSVWLLTKQKPLGWPIGLIYIVISMVMFLKSGLYGELLAHIVFFILSIYGWRHWVHRHNAGGDTFSPSYLKINQRFYWLMVLLFSSLVVGQLFAKWTNNPRPHVDSLVMLLSFAGMWLSAQKKMENWMLWALVNCLSIGIYLSLGLYVYAVLYCLFLAQAFNGFLVWKHSYARN